MRALITGANRGIGLEMAAHLARRGDVVFAGCRTPKTADDLHVLAERYPGHVHIVTLDVADEASIAASVGQVAAHTDALDLLVNNAAIVNREERLHTLTYEQIVATFSVNTFGPVLMFKHYHDLLKRGTRPVAVSITSEYSSLTDKQDGDLYMYCASKAALNMFTRTFAFDVAQDGIIAFIIDPGWVRTRMGGADADLSTDETVTGMLRLIDNATPADRGACYRWNGDTLAW
ncbi:MAG: SDR family oxidoreductase [Chloroflexota bacterium]|nr:SDR family oxidoreductase [Chloroflexota bacterium]